MMNDEVGSWEVVVVVVVVGTKNIYAIVNHSYLLLYDHFAGYGRKRW